MADQLNAVIAAMAGAGVDNAACLGPLTRPERRAPPVGPDAVESRSSTTPSRSATRRPPPSRSTTTRPGSPPPEPPGARRPPSQGARVWRLHPARRRAAAGSRSVLLTCSRARNLDPSQPTQAISTRGRITLPERDLAPEGDRARRTREVEGLVGVTTPNEASEVPPSAVGSVHLALTRVPSSSSFVEGRLCDDSLSRSRRPRVDQSPVGGREFRTRPEKASDLRTLRAS